MTNTPSFFTPAAQAENLQQLAAMADDTTPAQQAEHIRSMVAISLAALPSSAPTATHEAARQWQDWALGLAQQREQPVSV